MYTHFKFRLIADRWEFFTGVYSSHSQIMRHPYSRYIREMGLPAVPFIIERLKTGYFYGWEAMLIDIADDHKLNLPNFPSDESFGPPEWTMLWEDWFEDYVSPILDAPLKD